MILKKITGIFSIMPCSDTSPKSPFPTPLTHPSIFPSVPFAARYSHETYSASLPNVMGDLYDMPKLLL